MNNLKTIFASIHLYRLESAPTSDINSSLDVICMPLVICIEWDLFGK